MKSILYVGATLMIGASIYGFVDYKQTQGKKEFKEMYVEEKRTAPVVEEKKTTEPAVIKENVIGKKSVRKKKLAPKEEDILPIIEPIAADEMVDTREVKVIEKSSVNVTPSSDSNIEKKIVKKKKRLNTKLFSRAPLREPEEINLVEPAKTDVKKTDNKE